MATASVPPGMWTVAGPGSSRPVSTAAATTGLLRIMSDQHWVTDVLSGAVVGTAIGMIVPWVLHFQGGARPPLGGNDPPTITVLPMMGTDTLGVSVMGLL